MVTAFGSDHNFMSELQCKNKFLFFIKNLGYSN